jgi:predicted nuclease of predicted toxin-antitoxin system
MNILIDAQLSPSLALFINETIKRITATSVQKCGLRNASDKEIFTFARRNGLTILTKDDDFARLINEFGPPPFVILVTTGNTSNLEMRALLASKLSDVVLSLNESHPLVELGY